MSICNLDHFAESYWEPRRHVLVGGCFDPLHEGHLAYFAEARRLGNLVCAVSPDRAVAGKRTPCLPELTRLQVLNECRDIEHVHLASAGMPAVIRALKPIAYVVGLDWVGPLPLEERVACDEVGARIVFVDCREQSSTALLADYERRRNAEKLAAFEAFVSQQTPAAKPWEPVTPYDFESRQAIEGPHAQAIKDTFYLTSVIDVGCGPGHLMSLISRIRPDSLTTMIGADIKDGFDISAPLERTRQFDLVICREVLEHLTVQQIAVAVRNLVKLSSRYVYVTTRFTTGSALLDYSSADALDPTHISLLNQDYLRSLFVLEGCRRRADLEAKLDWMKKGRVLVYEVPA